MKKLNNLTKLKEVAGLLEKKPNLNAFFVTYDYKGSLLQFEIFLAKKFDRSFIEHTSSKRKKYFTGEPLFIVFICIDYGRFAIAWIGSDGSVTFEDVGGAVQFHELLNLKFNYSNGRGNYEDSIEAIQDMFSTIDYNTMEEYKSIIYIGNKKHNNRKYSNSYSKIHPFTIAKLPKGYERSPEENEKIMKILPSMVDLIFSINDVTVRFSADAKKAKSVEELLETLKGKIVNIEISNLKINSDDDDDDDEPF